MKVRFRNQNGAAIVEFAVLLPLLILFVFGIIEFGTLLYDQQILTNASREGARAGIVQQNPRVDPASIDNVVQTYCSNYLITFGNTNSPITTLTGYNSNAVFGQDLKVTVTYNYQFLVIPNFVPGLNSLRTMMAETLMRYE